MSPFLRGMTGQQMGVGMGAGTMSPAERRLMILSAPSVGQQPAQQAGVGAAREAQQGAELAADIERFQFEQARPQEKLQSYLAAVRGGDLGSTTYEAQQRQPLTSILGGALSGAELGGMVSTNPAAAGYGAGLGALAGLLG